jgi:hypothetical protein
MNPVFRVLMRDCLATLSRHFFRVKVISIIFSSLPPLAVMNIS